MQRKSSQITLAITRRRRVTLITQIPPRSATGQTKERTLNNMGYLTDGLTFNTLRGGNRERLPLFKNCHGETAHSEADGSDWTPAQWLQAVVGELGEYANFRKKFERGDVDAETFHREAKKELADVVIYLDILAMQLGIDLGQAVMQKFNETSRKVGARVVLDAEDWHLRLPTPMEAGQCDHD
jgi:NTP pyrophosphatase (non-canonical NTP hydrolase)